MAYREPSDPPHVAYRHGPVAKIRRAWWWARIGVSPWLKCPRCWACGVRGTPRRAWIDAAFLCADAYECGGRILASKP